MNDMAETTDPSPMTLMSRMGPTHRYFPWDEYRRAQLHKLETGGTNETHHDLQEAVKEWMGRSMNDPETKSYTTKGMINQHAVNWFLDPARTYHEIVGTLGGARYPLQGLLLMVKSLAKDVSFPPGVITEGAKIFMEYSETVREIK